MFEPKPVDSISETSPVDLVIVANQKTTRQIERTGFDYLLGGPLRSRMLGHVEVKDSPPLKAQDEEHVENAKRRSGHDGEVNCKGLVQMIAHERCPSLPRTRWRRALGHVARNGDLRYLDTQFEQFPMNSRSAPPHIHFRHRNNQLANLGRNSRSAGTPCSDLLSPEEFEALAMPGQNGGWFHHSQTFPPAIPEAGEQHPADTINGPNPGARSSVNEARKLVAQCNVLGDEICAILENGGNNGENQW